MRAQPPATRRLDSRSRRAPRSGGWCIQSCTCASHRWCGVQCRGPIQGCGDSHWCEGGGSRRGRQLVGVPQGPLVQRRHWAPDDAALNRSWARRCRLWDTGRGGGHKVGTNRRTLWITGQWLRWRGGVVLGVRTVVVWKGGDQDGRGDAGPGDAKLGNRRLVDDARPVVIDIRGHVVSPRHRRAVHLDDRQVVLHEGGGIVGG
mmetsp:Transcript_147463/g.257804  ORF Transcript_147463/g.257804 Transcript_147463/m.257804 type:complete len:203 (+) Transcript_147463:82-690(+)